MSQRFYKLLSLLAPVHRVYVCKYPGRAGALFPDGTIASAASYWNISDARASFCIVLGGSFMGLPGNPVIQQQSGQYDAHVKEVVRAAQNELKDLIRQRAEIMKRIGTVRQTLLGLANLFGEEVLTYELLGLVERKSSGRQPGFTRACRVVLMGAERSLTAREICERLRVQAPTVLDRHKDPLASVTTVLNRLVEYGEAQALFRDDGRRAWQWVAEGGAGNHEFQHMPVGNTIPEA